MFGKKQIISITEDNIRTINSNNLIEIYNKIYSALFKASEIKDEGEKKSHNRRGDPTYFRGRSGNGTQKYE